MSSNVTTALRAASKGDIPVLNNLRRHINLKDCSDKFGATLVHYAARAGKVECVEWLVNTVGLSGSKPANNGATPAHDAAATGNLDCLQWLIEHGSNSEVERDSCGATPLHLAARFGHLNVAVWLVEQKQCSALEKAQNGVTPVHLAAAKGSINCLKWLSQTFPSSVNTVADNGTSPTYFAAQEGKLECLKFLISQADADVHVRANDGMSPIHAAAQMGHLDCLAWIAENTELTINEKDNDGATPMHFAAARGHVKIIEWLLSQGQIIMRDDLGGTPLHDAAEHGQFEVIKVLVNGGVDAYMKDIDGLIPADLAEQCDHMQCANYLRAIPRYATHTTSSHLPSSEQKEFLYFPHNKPKQNSKLLDEVKHFAPQALKTVPKPAEKVKKISIKVGQIVEKENSDHKIDETETEKHTSSYDKAGRSGSISKQSGQKKPLEEAMPPWKRALLEKKGAKRSEYPPNSPLVPTKTEERRNSIPEWKKKLILQKQQLKKT